MGQKKKDKSKRSAFENLSAGKKILSGRNHRKNQGGEGKEQLFTESRLRNFDNVEKLKKFEFL